MNVHTVACCCPSTGMKITIKGTKLLTQLHLDFWFCNPKHFGHTWLSHFFSRIQIRFLNFEHSGNKRKKWLDYTCSKVICTAEIKKKTTTFFLYNRSCLVKNSQGNKWEDVEVEEEEAEVRNLSFYLRGLKMIKVPLTILPVA